MNENNWKSWPIIAVFLVAAFGVGYGFGQERIIFTKGKIEINKGAVSQTADYSLLWETFDLLNKKFVDRPLNQEQLLYGAVSGMVNAANDPYTVFFSPEDAKKFAEELRGSFEGIGIEIGIKDGSLVVVAPSRKTK